MNIIFKLQRQYNLY